MKKEFFFLLHNITFNLYFCFFSILVFFQGLVILSRTVVSVTILFTTGVER